MRRALLLFVVLGALILSTSLPAFTQEGEPQQGAAPYEPAAGELQYDPGVGEAQYDPGFGEDQYAQEEVAESGCGWQWGYRWNSAGGWEWWCYDPQLGWYYGENESGSGEVLRITGPGTFMIRT